MKYDLTLSFILLAVLCLVLSIFTPVLPTPEASPPTVCGSERWGLKTLADNEGFKLAQGKSRGLTIQFLTQVPAPSRSEILKATSERFPLELKLGRVQTHALILGYKLEMDSDFHVVLASPSDKSVTMIGEIPAPECVPTRSRDWFAIERAHFMTEFGRPTTQYKRLAAPEKVLVDGLFFFDVLHGQRGVAPNGAEIHPILDWTRE